MAVHASVNDTPAEQAIFSSIVSENGVCRRTLAALRIIAGHGVGLGEVLRDYAVQSSRQMQELIDASARACDGEMDGVCAESLRGAHYVLCTAATVLEMTPQAMQRNKAELLGEQDKIACEDLVRLARAFRNAPEIACLIASEEEGQRRLENAIGLLGLVSGQSSLEPVQKHC